MKTWRVVLMVTDDGISDAGKGNYLTAVELAMEISSSTSFVSGVTSTVESITEVKPETKPKVKPHHQWSGNFNE